MNFDPYSAWLDLPPGPRPPDPYALLGVPRFERDRRRLESAAADRVRLVNRKAPFDRGDEMRLVLSEIAAAERLLADPERRRRLEVELRAREKRHAPTETLPAAPTPFPPAAPSPRSSRPAPSRSSRRRVRVGPWSWPAAAAAAVVVVGLVWLAWPRSEPPAPGRGPVASVQDPAPIEPAPVGDARRDAPPAPAPKPPAEAAKPRFAARGPAPAGPVPVPPTRLVAVVAPRPPAEAPKPAVPSFVEYRPPRLAPADRDTYARHVESLLYEAFRLKGDPAKLAAHYRSAAALAPGDPFTEFAAALAYQKRLKFREADTHLAAARGPDDAPFLPGRRAAILLHLSRNRRPDALREAVAFAKVLAAPANPATPDERAVASRWLGRLTAALESPWLPDTGPSEEVARADGEIRTAVGPRLKTSYEAGRRSLREEYAARAAEVESRVAELSVAHEERQDQELEKIAEDRDAAQDEREHVTRTAAGWKDWFDKETRGLDEQLQTLDVDLRRLTARAEATAATYYQLSEGLRALEQGGGKDDPLIPVGPDAALVAAVNRSRTELNLLNADIADAQNRARVLLAKRQAVVARYEHETKTLTAKNDALRKWENILKRRAGTTESADADDTPAARALRRRLGDFDTYVPFDLEVERDRVLRALRESPAPTPTPNSGD